MPDSRLVLACAIWLCDEMGFEIAEDGEWSSPELALETRRIVRVPAAAFERASTLAEFQREVIGIVERARTERGGA